jgi:hypothetical protein
VEQSITHDFLINETFNQLILVVGLSFWLLTSNAHDFRCHLALAHLAETLRIKFYIKQLPQEGHSDLLHAMRKLFAGISRYPTWRKCCASLALRCIFMFRLNAFHAAGRNWPSTFCKKSLKTMRSTCSRTPTFAPFLLSNKPSCPRTCNWQGELEARGTK